MRGFALLTSVLIPFLLSAQKNFREGYIVTLKGDTVKGYIDLREWETTPRKIQFAPATNKEAETEYGTTSISSFEVLHNEAYQRFPVKISLAPAAMNEIKGRDTTTTNDTVFLRVLYRGKIVSLFSYRDRIKERFYILESGAEAPEELINREYYRNYGTGQVGAGALVSEKKYIDQLRNILYSKGIFTEQLLSKIQNATYTDKDLTDIVYRMNGLPREDQEKLHSGQASRIRFFGGAGLQRTEVSFSGSHPVAGTSPTTESSWLPRISAGIDLFANPNVGKLLFRVEAGYHTTRSVYTANRTPTLQRSYELSMSTFSLTPQLIFNLYHSEKIKLPLGVGLSCNKPFYSDKTKADNDHYDFELEKFYISPVGRAGIVFFNKIEASVLYQIPAGMTSYSMFAVNNRSLQFQVLYLLSNRKGKVF